MEQQKILIQGANTDVDVVGAMREGVSTIDKMKRDHGVGIDDMHDLNEEIQEH